MPEFTITTNLVSPIRLAIDKEDYIYVSDKNNKSLNVYHTNGSLFRSIPVKGKPVSVAVDSRSIVYYGDFDSGMIYKLDANGKATLFYADTQFPCDMVFGSDENLYVTDSYLNQVIVLDKNGTVVKKIGNGLLNFNTTILLK